MGQTRHPDVLVALRRIIRATDLHSKSTIRACGLTVPQIVVLNTIQRLGEVTLREIAEAASLSQATVTSVLNRLEQRGLVERIRSSRDRRVVHARLTDEGRKKLAEAPPPLHDKFIERFEALEDWEQAQILAALERVATLMDASDLDASPILDVSPISRDAS